MKECRCQSRFDSKMRYNRRKSPLELFCSLLKLLTCWSFSPAIIFSPPRLPYNASVTCNPQLFTGRIDQIVYAKSWVDGVGPGKHAVAHGGRLSPYPSSSGIVVIEVSPQIEFSGVCLLPAPGFLDLEVRSVHVLHVPAVSELGELSISSKSGLAETIAGFVAVDFETSDRVSDCEDSSCPAFIEGLVRVVIGSKIRVEAIVRAVERAGVDDAENGDLDTAGGVSFLRIASAARHPSHKAILLLRPNCGLERQSFLSHYTMPVVRVELIDAHARPDQQGQQQPILPHLLSIISSNILQRGQTSPFLHIAPILSPLCHATHPRQISKQRPWKEKGISWKKGASYPPLS